MTIDQRFLIRPFPQILSPILNAVLQETRRQHRVLPLEDVRRSARPGILLRLLHHASSNGVPLDIAHGGVKMPLIH
jgi:hypothetical protein